MSDNYLNCLLTGYVHVLYCTFNVTVQFRKVINIFLVVGLVVACVTTYLESFLREYACIKALSINIHKDKDGFDLFISSLEHIYCIIPKTENYRINSNSIIP